MTADASWPLDRQLVEQPCHGPGFAVDDQGSPWKARHCFSDGREAGGEVIAWSGDQAHRSAFLMGLEAPAIPLHFVDPLRARRRLAAQGKGAGSNEFRHQKCFGKPLQHGIGRVSRKYLAVATVK